MAEPPSLTVTTGPDQGFEIILPTDPKPLFGRTRAPVVVEINGYRYRSTVAAMGGRWFVPLRRSHRDAAGLDPNCSYTVVLTLDTLRLVRRFWPLMQSFALGDLIRTFGLQARVDALCAGRTWHDALYDACAGAVLFCHILSILKVKTYEDLCRYA